MARLIDADALLEEHCDDCSLAGREMCKNDPLCGVAMWIAEAPTVDAVPVVHGRWENFGEHRRMDLRCSVCGNRADKFVGGTEDWYCLWKPAYCPNCGAKMDLEVE